MAYADSDLTSAACSNEPIYMRLTEVLDNANWYDGVVALAISGGNFAITAATSPKTLVVYAIRANGDAPFIAPNADLDFTATGAGAVITAGLHTGIITFVGAGSSLVTVAITAVPTIEAEATCTAS